MINREHRVIVQEIFDRLKDKELISEDLLKDIDNIYTGYHGELAEVDFPIDYDSGGSALFHAAKLGELNLVKELVEMGLNKTRVDLLHQTLLHASVQSTSNDCVNYALEHLSSSELHLTEFNGMTALHKACEKDNINILSCLLNHPEIRKQIDVKDLYGRKPIDIAIEHKCDETIRILADDPQLDVTQLQNYGKPMLNLSQEHLEEQLTHYLNITGRSDISQNIINQEGMCCGWALLKQVFYAKGQKDELKEIYKLIATWDKTQESLNNQDLPSMLKTRYQKQYRNHQEPGDVKFVFEHLINYLTIGMSDDNPNSTIQQLGVELFQQDREKQYELMKSETDPQLTSLFNFPYTSFNREQLIEIFDFLSQWPGISVDIIYPSHIVSMQVLEDGRLDYYNPLFLNELDHPFSSQELADHILKTNNTATFKFRCFRFDTPNKPIAPIKPPTINPSFIMQNGFTPLHYAVICNDVKELNLLLAQSNRDDLKALDAHGLTPIMRALRSQHEACFLELLNANGDPSHSKQIVNSGCKYEDLEFLCELALLGKISPEFTDCDGNDVFSGLKTVICLPWEKAKFKRLDEQLENLKAEQQAKKAEPKKRNSLLYSVKETKHFPSNSTQEMPSSDLSKEISNKRVPKK